MVNDTNEQSETDNVAIIYKIYLTLLLKNFFRVIYKKNNTVEKEKKVVLSNEFIKKIIRTSAS